MSLLLLGAIPVLHALGYYWVMGNFFSLSIGQLDIADPAIVLQTFLLTKLFYLPLFIAALFPIALALIFGRTFCSWACPYNTIREWIDRLEKRYFRKHWRKEHPLTPANNPHPWIYWSIFACILLILMTFGLPVVGYLSMPGIISTEIIRVLSGMGVGLEILIVGIVIASEIVVAKRFWCKYVCPVGATLSLFRTQKTLRLHHNPSVCDCKGDTQPCHYVCPLNLSPKLENVYPYCFNCGLCIQICEKTGNMALTFRFGAGNRPVVSGSYPAGEYCKDCPVSGDVEQRER